MKKKKRRIDTFKNWLLARDSASRISTKSNYNSFLESEKKESESDLLFRKLVLLIFLLETLIFFFVHLFFWLEIKFLKEKMSNKISPFFKTIMNV